MRVGTICYATDQGIGILAKAFYDHGVITDALVVEHRVHPTHREWYPGAQVVQARALSTMFPDWARKHSIDVLFCVETPFDWSVFTWCREHNVKTALMPMYECTPLQHVRPDMYMCPSLLDYRHFTGSADGCTPFVPSGTCYTPTPVEVPWKLRTKAEVFVHNAGHGGLRGRNGTGELVDAWHLVKSPAKLILRQQGQLSATSCKLFDSRIEWRIGTVSREELYAEGDVFIFPEKFSGQSCPIEEALAAGMAVMATDRFPHNTYLHDDTLLIPASCEVVARIGGAYPTFMEAVVRPEDIAVCVDRCYGRDITELSRWGSVFADVRSWDKLGPKYKELLCSLTQKP